MTNIIIIALIYIFCQDLVVEEDGEEVGGGRRKKMRTTFTGKQVDLFSGSSPHLRAFKSN